MTDNSNQSSQDSDNKQQSQADEVTSSSKQKQCAPEHPPATPREQRTNSANFGEGDADDTVTFKAD